MMLIPPAKEILFEETHEGSGRIMEFAGFYYAEAKQGDAWQLVQFSEFPQVARMALDHVFADELEGAAARECTGAPASRERSDPLPLAGRRICPAPFARMGDNPRRGLTTE